jgi:hypothetical protein
MGWDAMWEGAAADGKEAADKAGCMRRGNSGGYDNTNDVVK